MTPRAKLKIALRELARRYGPLDKPARGDVLGALVETILSQNTTDLTSGRAYANLRLKFPDWRAALEAGPRAIESRIRVGGLARTKALRIHALLAALQAQHGRCDLEWLRELPTEQVIEQLLAIAGVGPKTALVVALFELRRPVFPMDTHVHRVLTRLAVTTGDRGRIETHRAIERLVAPERLIELHLGLIEFGREVCRPRPHCSGCPLRRICEYPEK